MADDAYLADFGLRNGAACLIAVSTAPDVERFTTTMPFSS